MYFDPSSLIAGQCYFLVSYFDNGMSIPDIETYIYVEKNVFPDDTKGEDHWYFQNPETYLSKGAFNALPVGEDYGVLRLDLDTLEASIKDFDGLCDFLAEIKSRISRG